MLGLMSRPAGAGAGDSRRRGKRRASETLALRGDDLAVWFGALRFGNIGRGPIVPLRATFSIETNAQTA